MVEGIYCLDRNQYENSYFLAAAMQGNPNVLTEEEALAFVASEKDSEWQSEFGSQLDIYLSGINPFESIAWQDEATFLLDRAQERVNAQRWFAQKIKGTVNSPWLLPFKILGGVLVGVVTTSLGIVNGVEAGSKIGRMAGTKKGEQHGSHIGAVAGTYVGTTKGIYHGARAAFDTSGFLFGQDPYGCLE